MRPTLKIHAGQVTTRGTRRAGLVPITASFPWLVLLALLMGLSNPAVLRGAISTQERDVLIDLYNSTNGANWTNKTNWLGAAGTECSWSGVGCNATQTSVLALNLGGNNLNGLIPSSIGTLANLQSLSLAFNKLSGVIPASIGNLSQLRGLALYENTLSGTIPASLGNLLNLTSLDLPGNQLTGEIPVELSNLSQLQLLRLSHNQLSGGIPPNLGNLSKLGLLSLDGNQLSGSIPSEIGNLFRLSFLDLHSNQLNGSIPATLGNLSSLKQLRLNNNQLTGAIPSELGGLAELEILDLSSNPLTGTIPAALGNLAKLLTLDLSSNQLSGQLSGTIPVELGNLANLQRLYLFGNQLSGTIPVELGNLANLQQLWLFSNQLSGTIPVEFGNLANLLYLYLDGNQLSGTIPVALGNLASLQYLNLSSNQLSGTIPVELGNLAKLQQLYLFGNQLSGTIPVELGNLADLRYLFLYSNQLSGTIPAELGSLADLRYVFLYSNQLSGTIPAELGNLSNLQLLYLSSNKLSGELPATMASLTSLGSSGLELRWNALYSSNASLISFLNSKQVSGNWQSTQTIAPTNVLATAQSSTAIQISWTPIAYTANSGRYQVLSSLASSGPYTLAGSTTSKSASSLILNSLNPSTPYYFVIRTVTDPNGSNQNTVVSEFSGEVSASTQAAPAPIVSLSPTSLTFADTVVGSTTAAQSVTLSNTGNGPLSITSIAATGDFAQTNNCGSALAASASCTINVTFTPTTGGPRAGALTITSSAAGSPHTVNLGGNGIVVVSSPERQALIDPYNSTNGANWTNKTNWLGVSGTECTWFGVVCNAAQTAVVQLSLFENNLIGSVPASLGNLVNLQVLQLFSNQLSGSIPASLGSLSNLTDLRLYNNQLTGPIPPELGSLGNLQRLYLDSNQLSGSIPSSLGSLLNLIELRLGNNQLTGPIPSELGSLGNLQFLYLHRNQLGGSIPPSLGSLPNLKALYLFNNRLTGLIPSQVGSLSDLRQLYLASNQLSGAVPGSLSGLILLTPNASDLRWNALYSPDAALVSFLNSKQIGGDWQSTQTITPTNVVATAQSSTSIQISWTPIAYIADTGRYQVLSSLTSSGPYTVAGSTADKLASSLVLSNLNPATPYYFVVRAVTDPHVNNQNTVTSESSAEISATTQAVTTPTSIALASSMNPSTLGKNVAFTATVTSSSGIPAGSVTFRDGATVLATVALNLSGQAIYPTTALAVGSHSITASYSGNAIFSASTSSPPPLVQTVNRAVPKITLGASKPVAGQVTLTATVTSTVGVPTGTATFKRDTTVLGSATLDASGLATFTTAPLAAGSYDFTATYNGDSNFEPLGSKNAKVTVK